MPSEQEVRAAAKVLAAMYSSETRTLSAFPWASIARRALEAAEAKRTFIVGEKMTHGDMHAFVGQMSRELHLAANVKELAIALQPFNLCYLASPYTKYPLGPDQAFEHIAAISASLLTASVRFYSPVAHSHPIAVHGGVDLSHATWMQFETRIMECADCLVVVMLDGWHASDGVRQETDYFLSRDLPIFMLDPDTLRITRREQE